MAVKRRKFGKRKSIHRKSRVRSLFGGYMGDGNGFEIGRNKSHLKKAKQKFLDDYEKNTPSKFWLPSYLDHKVNKSVIDDTTMNNILLEMNNNDQARRTLAREQLKDLLVMRDIEKNPDEYMREWLQGKHKKNTWVKTAAQLGLGTAATLAGLYGAYQWGTPLLGMLANGTKNYLLSHRDQIWNIAHKLHIPGAGFRMTKRGRKLLKRYRKCLRRKRC